MVSTEKDEDDGSSSESEDNDVESLRKSEVDSDNSADESKSEIDFEEEAEITKNVLQNIISSSSGNVVAGDDSGLSKGNSDKSMPVKSKISDKSMPVKSKSSDKSMPVESKSSDALGTLVATTVSSTEEKPKITNPQGEDELQRTIFISNLPFDITVEEVKQRFSAFGGVETFMLVLNPVTK